MKISLRRLFVEKLRGKSLHDDNNKKVNCKPKKLVLESAEKDQFHFHC